jgi:hypothetical protein
MRIAAACLLVAAATAFAAEERKDGPGIRFSDDLVSRLEGRWELTRTMRGQESKSGVDCDWVLEHQFLRVQMKDRATPPRYEAHVYIGWSNANQRYVIQWMDVWGGHYSLRGEGTRTGDTIEFRFPDPDGSAFFNTFAYDRAKDTWAMTLENSDKSGKRALFARERWERMR